MGLKITNLRAAIMRKNRDKPIVCHNCGKLGHKLPDCPLKVNRVATYNKTKLLSLDGAGCGKKWKLTVDSGTQITVVNESLVPKYEYTGDSIQLVGLRGLVTLPWYR